MLPLGPSLSSPIELTVNAPKGTIIKALTSDRAALPVKLLSFLPYRVQLNASQAGFLETPVVFIPGYEAQVNGAAVAVAPSGEGLLEVSVPRGASIVEINYVGPSGLWLGGWLTTIAIIVFIALVAAGPTSGPLPAELPVVANLNNSRRWICGVMLAIAAAAGCFSLFNHEHLGTIGKVRLLVQFPNAPVAQAEPILITGRNGRADILYVRYGEKSVQIGLDHWNSQSAISDPIPIHPGRTYLLEYESPALNLNTPSVNAGRVRVLIDGHVVFDQLRPTFAANGVKIAVGKNDVLTNVCSLRFSGLIRVLPDGESLN